MDLLLGSRGLHVEQRQSQRRGGGATGPYPPNEGVNRSFAHPTPKHYLGSFKAMRDTPDRRIKHRVPERLEPGPLVAERQCSTN